jgi:hypothetical protein
MQTFFSAALTRSVIYIALPLLVALSLLPLTQVKAATSISSYSITMTPSSAEIHAPPGGITHSNFTVINEGKSGYTIALSVTPYHVKGENYDPQFSLLPGTTDASKWVSITGPRLQTLAPRMPQTIAYSLSVPAGTPPGGYYAVVFAETEPPAGSGIIAHNRVGDILYITVDGPVVQRGSLQAQAVPPIFLGSSLPLGVVVRNTGGLHFLTSVSIKATSVLSNHVALSANLQRYVLPGTQRLVSISWAHLPLFGVYNITRTATIAGAIQSLPAQWIVIIQPWLAALIVVLVVGTVALGGTAFSRRRRRGARQSPRGSDK